MSFIPEHFSVLRVFENDFMSINEIGNWIEFHLNSRYSILKTVDLDNTKKISYVIKIGIEDPREFTMFNLGCPFIHNKQ